MSDDGLSKWDRKGTLLEEMERAGLAMELHKTVSKTPAFAWSFAFAAGRVTQKKFYYGETPHQAVQRGYDAWVKSLEVE